MAITSNWKLIGKKEMQKMAQAVRERIIAAFEYAGEEFIISGRSQPQSHEMGFYQDHSGNLRNSIAYYLFENGELIRFKEFGNIVENRSHLEPETRGFQLIGIAGMDYASYVEARGFNVITMQAEVCIINLGVYFNDIQQYINNGPIQANG